MPRQPSLPTMLVPALGTDDAKPRLTRGNNQTTSHPRTPRSPSRAQDHVHTVKEHSISFLTSPAPSYMPLGRVSARDPELVAHTRKRFGGVTIDRVVGLTEKNPAMSGPPTPNWFNE